MASDKQIEANRINAAKSTGPRTEEGKARVARNARRYAGLAESLLLQSENPERFYAFAHKFHREYRPNGPSERALVETLISSRWLLLRITSIEAAGIDREYELLRSPENAGLTIPMRANLAYRNLCDNTRSIETLSRMRVRYQLQFDGAYDRLTKLRAGRHVSESDAAKVPQLDPTA
jgi:hypothetical protein